MISKKPKCEELLNFESHYEDTQNHISTKFQQNQRLLLSQNSILKYLTRNMQTRHKTWPDYQIKKIPETSMFSTTKNKLKIRINPLKKSKNRRN
jgi:hypothetical protein